MRNFALILLVGLLTACDPGAFGPGESYFSVQLSGEYFLHHSPEHNSAIAPRRWDASTPVIPAKVVELDHDTAWVIAKQQHLRPPNPNALHDSHREPIPGEFSYWILNTTTPQVWGPLTEEQFASTRTKLGVPASLKLHDVDDYRP